MFNIPTKVPKKWGYELIIDNNEKYCGKILHMNSGSKCSMHFHILKEETWYVQSGKFKFKWISTDNANSHEKDLKVGDIIKLKPGTPHQLFCIEEGDIFETSTQHFDEDSYRIEKGDNQS